MNLKDRLRKESGQAAKLYDIDPDLLTEAADRIEELEGALESIVTVGENTRLFDDDMTIWQEMQMIARSILSKQDGDSTP